MINSLKNIDLFTKDHIKPYTSILMGKIFSLFIDDRYYNALFHSSNHRLCQILPKISIESQQRNIYLVSGFSATNYHFVQMYLKHMCIINISAGTKLYFLYMYVPPISMQLYLCLKQMRHTLQAFNVIYSDSMA